jgi:hypothetical protein
MSEKQTLHQKVEEEVMITSMDYDSKEDKQSTIFET